MMIKFIDIIKEEIKNIKIVYHVTNFDNAKNILTYNYFRPSNNAETNKYGLSTTYDENYNWGHGGIKFILDLNKLKKDFKIEFINSIVGIDEKEILILSNEIIKNINKYIKDILIIKNKDNSIKTKKDEIKIIINDYKRKYKI